MNVSAIGPVIGNLFLVFLFLQALLNPSVHKDFITNTSFIYFLTELFSLAGCLLLLRFKLHPEDLGLQRTTNKPYDRLVNNIQYFSIACFFIIGTLLIGYLLQSWFIPLFFSLSLLSKAYSKNFVAMNFPLIYIAISLRNRILSKPFQRAWIRPDFIYSYFVKTT